MSLFLFCSFQIVFNTIPCEKLWERPQRLGVPLHLQLVVNDIYIAIYAKVHINGNTHGKVKSNTFVRQGCPLSPALSGLHIYEL